jgi:hypothetical protein
MGNARTVLCLFFLVFQAKKPIWTVIRHLMWMLEMNSFILFSKGWKINLQ